MIERRAFEFLVPKPAFKIPSKASLQKNQNPQKPQKPKDTLEQIQRELKNCQRCKLSKGRTNIVFGEGNPKTKLLFVGEGPGETEDLQGRPFVGKAGQLLDKMIQAIGLTRELVYIANVVKCRPPQNRNPEADEIKTCSPFLLRQINVLRPQVIVALGKFAAQTLYRQSGVLQEDEELKISQHRGQFTEFQGAKLLSTYHPAYLLRNPSAKKEVWEDLKKVALELNLKIVSK